MSTTLSAMLSGIVKLPLSASVVFEADGTFAHHINGNMNCPWSLTFDPYGNLHVANYTSNVSIFSPDGKYISQYVSQVTNPAGIAIDEGYMFIKDYYTINASYN